MNFLGDLETDIHCLGKIRTENSVESGARMTLR